MRRKSIIRNILTSLVVLGIIVAIWYINSTLGPLSDHLPTPREVLVAILKESVFSELLPALWQTVSTVIQALVLGTFVGHALGLLFGLNQRIQNLGNVTFNAIRAIPVTVLLPLFLALFGITGFFLPIIALPIALHTAVNVIAACKQVNKNRSALLTSYGVRLNNYVWNVLWFESTEAIFSTLRVMIPFALALEIALDYFLNTDMGLGAFISARDGQLYRIAEVYAAVLLAAGIGIISTFSLDLIAGKALKWKRNM